MGMWGDKYDNAGIMRQLQSMQQQISQLQRTVDRMAQEMGISNVELAQVTYGAPPASVAGAGQAVNADGSVWAKARLLVADGKKIQAIKEVREATGLGLKEAKDAVEQL